MPTKKDYRKKILFTRNALPFGVRRGKSVRIAEKLEFLPVFRRSKTILFYYGVNSEVKTLPLIKKYAGKKHLYLPVITSKKEFMAIKVGVPLCLKRGKAGIPEPSWKKTACLSARMTRSGEPARQAKQLDLVVVPGIVFDIKGNRLGTGKGYYDRFLKRYPDAFKIGLAYQEQIVARLPHDPYDVPMNLIITDKNIYGPLHKSAETGSCCF